MRLDGAADPDVSRWRRGAGEGGGVESGGLYPLDTVEALSSLILVPDRWVFFRLCGSEMERPSPNTKAYRRRRPERSVLYRAMAHHFETFLQVYDERFQPTFGHLRSVVQKAVYRFLDCGILERGYAVTD